MRTFLLAGAAVLLAAAPALAQGTADQSQAPSGDGTPQMQFEAASPGQQLAQGGGPGSGMVLLVPPSLGMPPGTVMVIPHPASAQGGNPGQGMAQQATPPQPPQPPGMPTPPPPHRPPPMGAAFRLRHGGDEIDIHCPTGEPTQACIQAVGPVVDRFLSTVSQGSGSQGSGSQGSGSQGSGSQSAGAGQPSSGSSKPPGQ